MADIKKYAPINGGNLFSDFKIHFSIFRTLRTFAIAYLIVFVFIAFTIFLAFSPSSNSSSPWFTNIFAVSTSGHGAASSTSPTGEAFGDKVEVLKANQSSAASRTVIQPPNPVKHVTLISGRGTSDKSLIHNFTSSLMKKQNTSANTSNGEQGMNDLINSLMNCDLFDGNWVKDNSYPLYKPGSCSLINEQFNCFRNGRPDKGYHKLKWKPKGCALPRLKGRHMLELLRGKRLVFVGDSLNRNMWESLICILKNSVKDQKKVYEKSSMAVLFEDYKCWVEFFVSPFLVQEWQVSSKNGTKKETLRLDMIGSSAEKYKNADVIVFNTGHWWSHKKTSNGKDYYQEGSHVYSELDGNEAFRRALMTWGRWVDANVSPLKSLVFFRGLSATHYSGRQWNSRGTCDHETKPIKNEKYLTPYPPKMTVLEKVLNGMKIHVSYMNISRMTDYRKDGHPSIYCKRHFSEEGRRSPLSVQDCGHWCLPGVPDAWNEILYAELLVKLNKRQQQKK